MTSDNTIFGLRFKCIETLQPSLEDLKQFLDSRGTSGSLHNDDLAAYRDLLKMVEDRSRSRRSASSIGEYRDSILYGVLQHSHLVTPALKLAVEQYQYHVHALGQLDFRKPTTFVRSAEAELAKLNPKKREEAGRIARMKTLVDDRKRDLDKLKRQWLALAEELGHIADYVRDNLGMIERLCESSITVLVGDQLGGSKEQAILEDLKAQFKAQLRDFLHSGTITQAQLDQAKEDVAAISRRISEQLREDVYALTGLYETIHERVAAAGGELRSLQDEIAKKKHADFDQDLDLYRKIGTVLIALVADPGFRVRVSDAPIAGGHDEIVFEKRQEMLAHLFDLLQSSSR